MPAVTFKILTLVRCELSVCWGINDIVLTLHIGMKIMLKGLDQLQRQLKEAQEVLQALDGELCTVNFNPHDLSSIEQAIQQVENVIDERTGQHASNPIIQPLAAEMKERYRSEILDRAAAARLEAD